MQPMKAVASYLLFVIQHIYGIMLNHGECEPEMPCMTTLSLDQLDLEDFLIIQEAVSCQAMTARGSCLGSLHCDLDPRLQHRHWEVRRRHAGQPQAEVGMQVRLSICAKLGHLPFQFRHPGLGQMTVLEANPMTYRWH